MPLLKPGDPFPDLEVTVPDGGTISLPESLAGCYAVVLFYRGAWCPSCNAQLRAFQRAKDALAELGIRIVALSVDDEATTRETIESHRLEYPVGYGADARALAAATGAFINEDPLYVQSTGFVLDRDGVVLVSVYSSGAIGRLLPDDVIRFVRHQVEQRAA